jgi:hypothetical protein
MMAWGQTGMRPTMRSIRTGFLAIAMAGAVMTPTFADEAADIAAIKAGLATLDDGFHTGNTDAIRTMMTPDHLSITFASNDPQTVDEQLASLPELKLIEIYDALPPTIAMLGPDAALVTMEQSYRGTFRGNPVPNRVFISGIWVKGGGVWRERFYQETAIEPE